MVFTNNVAVCHAETREKHVFTSNGHIVNIQITAAQTVTQNNFLLKYEGMHIKMLHRPCVYEINTVSVLKLLLVWMCVVFHCILCGCVHCIQSVYVSH